jgi:hypothetical protein
MSSSNKMSGASADKVLVKSCPAAAASPLVPRCRRLLSLLSLLWRLLLAHRV